MEEPSPSARTGVVRAGHLVHPRCEPEAERAVRYRDEAELAGRLEQRSGTVEPIRRPPAPDAPAAGEPLRPEHVVAALAERLPENTILVEEAPSNRAEILARISIRAPLGFVAVANGALGFGLASAVGLRMARPDRPVLALLGDGSSMYSVHALWSAAHYGVGTVFVVMSNGRYAIMDHLADAHGAPGAWPSFHSLDIAAVATGLGCPARQVVTHDELVETLDEAMLGLTERDQPLVIEARIE